MRSMNLTKLEYFLSAARTLSFTEAARENYISQTAISQQIGALEAELGVQLFRRNKKRVELTEAGVYLKGEAEELLDHYRRIEAGIRRYSEAGVVRLEYTGPIERRLASDLLEKFYARWPESEVRLKYASRAEAGRDLAEGRCDLLICSADAPKVEEGLEEIPLEEIPILVAVGANSPLAGRESLTVDDLAGEKVVALSRSWAGRVYDRIRALLTETGFRRDQIVEVDDLESQFLLIELGQGISFLPGDPEIQRGKVALIPLQGAESRTRISLFFLRETPVIKRFLSIC